MASKRKILEFNPSEDLKSFVDAAASNPAIAFSLTYPFVSSPGKFLLGQVSDVDSTYFPTEKHAEIADKFLSEALIACMKSSRPNDFEGGMYNLYEAFDVTGQILEKKNKKLEKALRGLAKNFLVHNEDFYNNWVHPRAEKFLKSLVKKIRKTKDEFVIIESDSIDPFLVSIDSEAVLFSALLPASPDEFVSQKITVYAVKPNTQATEVTKFSLVAEGTKGEVTITPLRSALRSLNVKKPLQRNPIAIEPSVLTKTEHGFLPLATALRLKLEDYGYTEHAQELHEQVCSANDVMSAIQVTSAYAPLFIEAA